MGFPNNMYLLCLEGSNGKNLANNLTVKKSKMIRQKGKEKGCLSAKVIFVFFNAIIGHIRFPQVT